MNNPGSPPPNSSQQTNYGPAWTELRDRIHALERFGPTESRERVTTLSELEWEALARVAQREDGTVETMSLAAFLARTSHWQKVCHRHDLPAQAAACRTLADEAIEEAAQEWIRQSSDEPGEVDLDTIFHRLTESGHLLSDIHGRDGDGEVAVHRVSETREELRELLRQQLAANPAPPDQLGRWARLVADQCISTLTAIDDLPPDRAVTQIESTLDDANWYLTHVDPTRTKSSRIVKSKVRRLRAELQERQLQSRLESRFGIQLVSLFERFILLLILLVLALLAIEWTFPLSAQTTAVFELIDTIACSFFLVEFFTKLSLAENKARWFRRHFLIDFIPSIPFRLLTNAWPAIDLLRTGRFARFAKLPRIVRYARSLRPLLEFVRALGLMARGIDRIVRQYSHVINCNVILHPTQDEYARYAQEKRHADLELELLCYQIHDIWTRLLLETPVADRLAVSQARLQLLARVLDIRRIHFRKSRQRIGTRDIPAEALLDRMQSLEPALVEPVLGEPMMVQLARIIQTVSVAPFRWLPLIRHCIPRDASLNTDAELVAAASRRAASSLRKIHDLWFWFTDLYGTVTPAQFVDRAGSILVKGSARPAIRLALFGGVLVLIEVLFTLIGLPDPMPSSARPQPAATTPANSVAVRRTEESSEAAAERGLHIVILTSARTFLRQVVGATVMVVGGICLFFLVLGKWLQHLAREATEFYEKSVQAQFLHLTEMIRPRKLERDAAILYARVLQPDDPEDHTSLDASLTMTIERMRQSLLRSHEAPQTPHSGWSFLDRFVLIYRDWLGGGLFTSGDTRVTNQLLGSSALRQLLLTSHRISKKNMRTLSSVDLEMQKSLFRGPFIWFHFIAQSIAHSVACLLVDYNRRAIPQRDLADASEPLKTSYTNWLSADTETPKEHTTHIEDETRYVTTEFTALHFLDPDQQREDDVEKRFGNEVLQRMKRDRSHVIRRTFGTLPLHRLPRSERIVNLYALYESWIAAGRVFLLPLFVLGVQLRVLGRTLGWLYDAVKEIRHPEHRDLQIDSAQADFRVAVRKINRIRGPVAEQCARLRSLLDPAWLGTPLPRETETRLRGAEAPQDLEFLRLGPAVERDLQLERLRSQDSMRRFESLLDDGLLERAAVNAGAARTAFSSRSHLRAAGVAIHADLYGIRSHLFAQSLLADVYNFTEATPSLRDYLLPRFRLRAAFRRYWKTHVPGDSTMRRKAWKATLEDENGVAGALLAWSRFGDAVQREGETRLGNLLLHPDRISEQLATLRMLQTLTVLDVLHYREHVMELGEYGGESADCADYFSGFSKAPALTEHHQPDEWTFLA
ncbi:MAG: ion transporter [Planctomycetota bacterium]|nr:ion transporter [Planctomycetota bacterium]